MGKIDICIDFDGTCVTHEFPAVGKPIGSVPVLKALAAEGHRLILNTMRSNKTDNTEGSACIPEVHNGNFLDDAVAWFAQHEIPLAGINKNPDQDAWTTSPKVYGQLYIDDAALGAPLCENLDYSLRPFLDWDAAYDKLIEMGLLKYDDEVDYRMLTLKEIAITAINEDSTN